MLVISKDFVVQASKFGDMLHRSDLAEVNFCVDQMISASAIDILVGTLFFWVTL